jgi:hypothetical protein
METMARPHPQAQAHPQVARKNRHPHQRMIKHHLLQRMTKNILMFQKLIIPRHKGLILRAKAHTKALQGTVDQTAKSQAVPRTKRQKKAKSEDKSKQGAFAPCSLFFTVDFCFLL